MRPDDPMGDWGTDGGASVPDCSTCPLATRCDRVEDNDDHVARQVAEDTCDTHAVFACGLCFDMEAVA